MGYCKVCVFLNLNQPSFDPFDRAQDRLREKTFVVQRRANRERFLTFGRHDIKAFHRGEILTKQ